jgi:hypothetical protein
VRKAIRSATPSSFDQLEDSPVDEGSLFVNRPLQILPPTFDFHICLIAVPDRTNRRLSLAMLPFKLGRILQHPSVNGGMVDVKPALLHHLLKPTVAQPNCAEFATEPIHFWKIEFTTIRNAFSTIPFR